MPFAARGLDAFEIGLLCYDEWSTESEILDRQTGEVVQPVRPAGNRYGIRYSEAEAMEAAYQRRRLDRIDAKVG